MSFAIIIPSRNGRNLGACVKAIRAQGETAQVVVVDDFEGATLDTESVDWVKGERPFIFARNMNIGIRRAAELGHGDVVLVNDDALLRTRLGFSLLGHEAGAHPKYGLIAATTNNSGNRNQRPLGIGLRSDPRMVCFVAVYIPRRTLDSVGLLDERFIGYGMDDDDYCFRVRNAGLKLGIHDGCFVDHKSLQSTFRGAATAPGDYQGNLALFKLKWGVDREGRPA